MTSTNELEQRVAELEATNAALRTSLARLEILHATGQSIASQLDLEKLLQTVTDAATSLTSAKFGAFFYNRVNESGEDYLLFTLSGAPREAFEKFGSPRATAVFAPTFRGEGPVRSDDITKDPRYGGMGPHHGMPPGHLPVCSYLAVAVKSKSGEVFGGLFFGHPEPGRFSERSEQLIEGVAAQAAVAIENARLYEQVRRNEERIEKELRFAQRVQGALLPSEPPRRLRNADVAGRFAPAHELGGDLHDFIDPEPNSLVIAVGDVSGKGAPAALYSAFAAELVRSRTYRRRYTPEKFSVSGVLQAMNTILHDRQLEEYYCTLCYAFFDFKRRTVTISNSGLPYPVRCSDDECGQIELPGVPLGAFSGVTYDEVTLPLRPGDVFVFCTDGIFEASSVEGKEFGAQRLCDVVRQHRKATAREIVDAIFDSVILFRGTAPQADDMTAVAVKITA